MGPGHLLRVPAHRPPDPVLTYRRPVRRQVLTLVPLTVLVVILGLNDNRPVLEVAAVAGVSVAFFAAIERLVYATRN